MSLSKIKILIAIWLAFGFAFAWASRFAQNESVGLFLKKAKLLEVFKDRPSRVIIAGGSNAFWNMRSSELEAHLDMPVINLAIPSEINDPMLMRELALSKAKAGDTVIYSSLEFWNQAQSEPHKAVQVAKSLRIASYLEGNLSALERLLAWWMPYPREVNPARALIQSLFKEVPSDPWSPFMDKNGDYTACLDIPVVPLEFNDRIVSEAYIQKISQFRLRLEAKGAKLVNIAPWILVKNEEKNLWHEYYSTLMNQINPASTHRGSDLVLRSDQSDFCECAWHLKPEHGLARAHAVLEQLKGS